MKRILTDEALCSLFIIFMVMVVIGMWLFFRRYNERHSTAMAVADQAIEYRVMYPVIIMSAPGEIFVMDKPGGEIRKVELR